MSDLSDFVDVNSGTQLRIGAVVTRVKANENGNRPEGRLVGTAPGGMALIRFYGDNDRPTSPGGYGLRYVSSGKG